MVAAPETTLATAPAVAVTPAAKPAIPATTPAVQLAVLLATIRKRVSIHGLIRTPRTAIANTTAVCIKKLVPSAKQKNGKAMNGIEVNRKWLKNLPVPNKAKINYPVNYVLM